MKRGHSKPTQKWKKKKKECKATASRFQTKQEKFVKRQGKSISILRVMHSLIVNSLSISSHKHTFLFIIQKNLYGNIWNLYYSEKNYPNNVCLIISTQKKSQISVENQVNLTMNEIRFRIYRILWKLTFSLTGSNSLTTTFILIISQDIFLRF